MNQVVQAQVLEIQVIDTENETVPFATIYKNGMLSSRTDVEGRVYLNVNPSDTIRAYQAGLKGDPFIVPLTETDSIRCLLTLRFDIQEIQEVTVKSEQNRKVLGKLNEHILDFYPLPNEHFYVLKLFEKKYYLAVEKQEGIIDQVELSFKPLSLYKDFLGNIHVLSKDSSYQTAFQEQLVLYEACSMEKFNAFVKPVVAKANQGIYTETFTNHNQRYFLNYKEKEKDLKNVLYLRDMIAEQVAQTEYNALISLYHTSVTEIENVILNGIWNGDVNQLMNNVTKAQLIWYSKIRSLPMNITSLDDGNRVLCFNFNEFQIHQIKKGDSTGKYIQIQQENFPKKPSIIQDELDRSFYVAYLENGTTILYRINPDTGALNFHKALKGFPYLTQLKISNGVVYFLHAESQFAKLIGIPL